MQYIKLLVCILAVYQLSFDAHAAVLYGATAGPVGELYILDPATGGVVQDIGPLNDATGRNYPMTGLAFHPGTGVLYGSTHDSSTADPATVNRLVTIDPYTALVTVIGQFIPTYDDPGTMKDLAFSPRGSLYGIGSYGIGPMGAPKMFSIDTSTARTEGMFLFEFIGSVNGGGIAWRSGYANYLWPFMTTPTADRLIFSYLQPFEPRSGWYTWTIGNPAKPAGGGNYGALDFDDGVLYGVNVGPGSPASTHLVTLDPGNAAVIDLGRSVDWLEAIAFQPENIPEPETLTISVTILAMLIGRTIGRLRVVA